MKNIFTLLAVLAFTFVNAQVHVVAPNGNVGVGIETPDEKLDVDGKAVIRGTTLTVGYNRLSNGGALLNLVGDVSNYPEYGIRLIRTSSGISSFTHRGTNILRFLANEGGSVQFRASGIGRLTIDGTGTLPGEDDTYNLGSANRRWDNIYTTNGIIQTSDKNLKSNIKNLKYGLNEILELRPVIFNWKEKENEDQQIGLIAQEVEKVIKEIVKRSDYILEENDVDGKSLRKVENERLGMNYSSLIPVLINATQEQQAIIEAKEDRITQLENDFERLEKMINDIQNTSSNSNHTSVNLTHEEFASLEQNRPNPFNGSTIVEYIVPSKAQTATMNIIDIQGKVLKQVIIDHVGQGTLEINAYDMPAGIYLYELVVDGQKVSSKKMILQN